MLVSGQKLIKVLCRATLETTRGHMKMSKWRMRIVWGRKGVLTQIVVLNGG